MISTTTFCLFCCSGKKPSFTATPLKSYIVKKSTGNLEVICAASGTPTPKLSWLRDNDDDVWPRPIVTSTSPGMNKLIIVPVVSVKDAHNITGWYTCRASNQYGTIYADFNVIAHGEFNWWRVRHKYQVPGQLVKRVLLCSSHHARANDEHQDEL